ncbi:hypothetical protein LSTR_LSTR000221 [Laodelphax striatellus]|uniref:PDZ and LIM domain-containing protein n=1 Tax=Laodelphax striatellus TaxID=195883 RepID=A0A482X6V8_LAOST|nr:hypothetical protein LSTR_LSTR000221 [Laodelphax striatellus]
MGFAVTYNNNNDCFQNLHEKVRKTSDFVNWSVPRRKKKIIRLEIREVPEIEHSSPFRRSQELGKLLLPTELCRAILKRAMSLRPTHYNSPLRLYSPVNVAEALNKQTQVLQNGAVGIDFHNLAKPSNLANSAVLRMLEEEERSGRGAGLKLVAWPPPPPDTNSDEISEQGPVYAQGPPRGQVGLIRPSQYHPPHQQHEPPPSTITLRQSAPFSQPPHPVFMSQPATATAQGGHKMRGDDKWPPETVKQQAAAENEARLALAKGPAFRPRKVQKDYSSFFAQNALTSTYPGYRAPPGTQHYEEGVSDL